MPIKLPARGIEISPNFQAGLRKLYMQWVKSRLTWRQFPSDQRLRLGHIRSLLSDPGSWDREMTRLRGLPFVAYQLVRLPDCSDKPAAYIKASTREVIIDIPKYHFSLGAYDIYIPFNLFEGGSADGIHFVPRSFPLTENRHPHHYARWPYGYEKEYPTQMRASTCWGSFAPLVTLMAQSADLPELLRTLWLYTSRFDPRSPLVVLRSIPHLRWL